MIDMSKYKFYRQGNKIYAVSTYAGKTVRGVASCDPRDEFDEEKGKELAAARCNYKVAYKRYKRAIAKEEEAWKAKNEADQRYSDMSHYLEDSEENVWEAKKELYRLEIDLAQEKE